MLRTYLGHKYAINNRGMFIDGIRVEKTSEELDKYQKVRFWCKVAITANDNLCWEWLGRKSEKGYGLIGINYSQARAHRLAYLYQYGIDPKDKLVCHKCDNPSCCNPKHLFLGTPKDNTQDMIKKGRQYVPHSAKTPVTKFKEEEIIDIINLRKAGVKVRDIMLKYPISKGHVNYIIQGKVWKYLHNKQN